jgi:hypothetical protein
MVIPFQLATLVLSLQPLGLVMRGHFFTDKLEKGQSVVGRCTESAVSLISTETKEDGKTLYEMRGLVLEYFFSPSSK